MPTPTQRSLAKLRDEGWTAEVVEKWVPFPKPGHRRDLFLIGDILALRGPETLLVQTTSTGVSTRIQKIRAAPVLPALLAAGWRVEVWGWRKVGARGRRKLWEVRVEEVK